jgi:hypothetical protein
VSKYHPRISVAATAICNHISEGGWIGASYPWYIKECRRLRPGEYRAARHLANKRFAYHLEVLNAENFRREAE